MTETQRAAIQRVLEACEQRLPLAWQAAIIDELNALRAALAEPEPEPFIFKCYGADERPIIKGNGFDGLEVGCDRDEAEQFVSWVNARITTPPARSPLTDEELRQCFTSTNTAEPLAEGWPGLERFARAVERAHGITGGTDE